MKGVIAAVVAAAALVAAVPASAATPTDRKIATLQKQVRTLQRDVRRLRTQVNEARSATQAAILLSFCSTAITADTFQATWQVIDQVAGRAIFGAQQAVREPGICSALQVPRPQPVPPTVSPFTALLRFVNQRSARASLG